MSETVPVTLSGRPLFLIGVAVLVVSLFLVALSAGYGVFITGLLFLIVAGFGLYVLSAAGRFMFDAEGIEHVNFFGRYRMPWRDIQSVVRSPRGTMLFRGGDQRLQVPFSVLSGPKAEVVASVTARLEAAGIVPVVSSAADTTLTRNCRVNELASGDR